MGEKWKCIADKGGFFGAVLTDFSKSFNGLLHNLLIAKLKAYGFENTPLKYIHSYLYNRRQGLK